MDKVQKEKIVSVNFSHAVFSLWDFLNLEAELIGCTKMLAWNYFSLLHNIQHISHGDLAMQAVVWLHITRLRVPV